MGGGGGGAERLVVVEGLPWDERFFRDHAFKFLIESLISTEIVKQHYDPASC